MEGKETYRFATRTLATTALDVDRARPASTPADIDLFIPHQANIRIIEAVAKGLDLPMDRMFVNLDKYGNTSAASVPIALAEAVNEGRVKVGDQIVIVAFGAGFTSGAVDDRVDRRPGPRDRRRRGRRPEDVHVRLPVDWDSVDPIPRRARRADAPARARSTSRSTTSSRASPAPQPRAGGPRMIDLTGKTALVTGGSRGIGRAIVAAPRDARAPTSRSATRATRRPRPRPSPTVEALGRRALAVQGDASRAEAAETRRQGRPRGLRQDRHPGQQRRHHPRRPDHADDASRPGARSSRRTCSARSTRSRP